MRKLTAFLAVIVAGSWFCVATASAAPLPELQCGQPITTSVRLTHDLTCATGFFLLGPADGAVPITIDLGGHTLSVAPAGLGGCGFNDPIRHCAITDYQGISLTIENGTVGGAIGLSAAGESGPEGLISRVHVEGDVFIAYSGGTLRDSQVDGAVHAIALTNTIRHDTIHGGIIISDGTNGLQLTITDNLIVKSPGAGILLQSSFSLPDITGTIARNVIYRSAGDGIGGNAENLGNPGGSSPLAITGNLLLANGGDGIGFLAGSGIQGGGSATIARNLAAFNHGHGFELTAPESFTTHGNIAFANALAPQCVGLVCGR